MNVLFLKRRSGNEALMFFLKKGHQEMENGYAFLSR